MAQTPVPSEVDVAALVDEAITEGRKLTDYIFMDAAHLDAAEGLAHPSTRQLDPNATTLLRTQWSHYIGTSNSDVRLKPIADALATLRVGCVDHGNEAYMTSRTVNVKSFPRGFNIPVCLLQDKNDTAASRSDCGRYEVIYNVHDGIIIIGLIKRPRGEAREGPQPFIEPSEVIGAMFRRLHIRYSPEGSQARGALIRATDMVYKAVNEHSHLPVLPRDTAGQWLPAALYFPGVGQGAISTGMRQFLNYVVVYVNASHEAYAIVQNCVGDILQRTWDNKETFVIGNRGGSYYALLGSDIGQGIAWLLAKRKTGGLDSLASKCIQSITAFCARRPEGMSTEEVRRYHTAVLVFEVVETSEELRAKHANQWNAET